MNSMVYFSRFVFWIGLDAAGNDFNTRLVLMKHRNAASCVDQVPSFYIPERQVDQISYLLCQMISLQSIGYVDTFYSDIRNII